VQRTTPRHADLGDSVRVGTGAPSPQADDGAGKPAPAVAVDDGDDEQRAMVDSARAADGGRSGCVGGRRRRRGVTLRSAARGGEPEHGDDRRQANPGG
jgi:hypothetical protein